MLIQGVRTHRDWNAIQPTRPHMYGLIYTLRQHVSPLLWSDLSWWAITLSKPILPPCYTDDHDLFLKSITFIHCHCLQSGDRFPFTANSNFHLNNFMNECEQSWENEAGWCLQLTYFFTLISLTRCIYSWSLVTEIQIGMLSNLPANPHCRTI